MKNYITAVSSFILFIFISITISSCQKEEDNQTEVIPPVHRSMQVWLHRVNSIEKAQYFVDKYVGYELDVHFDTSLNTFIVKHDFSDTTHLLFRTWLSSFPNPGDKPLWLDFKNLNAVNKDSALSELLKIRDEFHLTKHIIVVENNCPAYLIKFDTLNFRTSFYIPYFNPANITEEEELQYKNFIEEGIAASGIKTISGYTMQHEFMKKWFPKMNKLTWYLDSYDKAKQDSVIALIREDPTVEVILVTEEISKSRFLNPGDPFNK